MATQTVLIADDEDEIRRILGRKLCAPGVSIMMFSNGADAWEAVQKLRPDLVILDFFMPQMDGFETCRAMRADARTRDIPVLMLSGMGAGAEDCAQAGSGPDVFLSKPIDFGELTGWVQRLLQGRSAASA